MSEVTWQTFRDVVRAKFAADIAAEDARSESLRAEVVPALRDAVAQARSQHLCDRVWLFGSFAWGQPSDASDIDLLIEGDAAEHVATAVTQHCRRMVHAIRFAEAPDTLRERVLAEGLVL